MIKYLYGDGWFNLGMVFLATAGGLTQSFIAVIVPLVYLLGFIVYSNNK